MKNNFVVRIRLPDPEQAPRVTRELKECFETPADVGLINDYLVLRPEAAGDIDRMLVSLQNCLGKIDTGAGEGRAPEIVETGFAGQGGKIELAGDIVIDPAFSFGSGSHPSTGLAMCLLEGYAEKQFPGRALDVGCGSGILALMAAGLGAAAVLGVEIDPESVQTARKNVEANSLSGRVSITDQPLSEIRGEFDLILANLTASVLYNLAGDINRLTAEKAHLIVSGLQGRQAEEAASLLENLGWAGKDQEDNGKWRALLMEKLSL
ncbi:MAG: 50S ribosomal protein L11 methyltransferase [Thermodesulfobacteriota bacterium]